MRKELSSFGLVTLMAAWFLLTAANGVPAEDTQRYWIFFRDKGIVPSQMAGALSEAAQKLTPAARARRLKEMPVLVDEHDLPVNADYVEQVRSTGAILRQASRWLNAVSVEATGAQVQNLNALPCVQKVDPFRLRPVRIPRPARGSLDDLNYGSSFVQDSLCRIPQLHNRGLSGRGVLICILDTGAWLFHDVFDSLHVVAAYDFVNHDSIVWNEPEQDDAGQHYHGTATLSAMSGYKDSVLIGPAYGADILVAKTEWTAGEVRSEEDNYIAGLEWADSLGAQITTSSLGYIGTAPDFWYSFEDLDGHTAVTTRGLEMATSRGILCVTAAGNENGGPWNHILTPADADSILAVGAVDTAGTIVGFSSRGPTADGRIKPEVCAMGADVFCARADSNDYWRLSGTSLATPIVAGIAALLMEDHPDWTAQEVREAIMNTASQHAFPNNDYGWGIANAEAAADYVLSAGHNPKPEIPKSAILVTAYPNPVNGTGSVRVVLPAGATGTLVLFDVLGRQVYAWPKTQWAAGENRVSFVASDFPTGIYVAEFKGAAANAAVKLVILK